MIRIYSFVVATIRKYSYTSVNRSSLNVNHSLKFTIVCSPMLEERKNLSIYNMYLFANVRTSSQIIAKIRHGIVLGRLISRPELDTLRSQTLVDERNANT